MDKECKVLAGFDRPEFAASLFLRLVTLVYAQQGVHILKKNYKRSDKMYTNGLLEDGTSTLDIKLVLIQDYMTMSFWFGIA